MIVFCLETFSNTDKIKIPICCFPKIFVGKEDWKKEIVNGSRSFFVLKGLTPGTAYKVRVGAEGLFGFRSSEDVFETGPGEAHVPLLSPSQNPARSSAGKLNCF